MVMCAMESQHTKHSASTNRLFASPSVCIDVLHDDSVVLLTFAHAMRSADTAAYEEAYAKMYDAAARFVLVFDVRSLHVPSCELIMRQTALIMACKPRTAAQVQSVVVLSASKAVCELITRLVKAAGQSAPFYMCASMEDAHACIVRSIRAMFPISPARQTLRPLTALLLAWTLPMRVAKHFAARGPAPRRPEMQLGKAGS